MPEPDHTFIECNINLTLLSPQSVVTSYKLVNSPVPYSRLRVFSILRQPHICTDIPKLFADELQRCEVQWIQRQLSQNQWRLDLEAIGKLWKIEDVTALTRMAGVTGIAKAEFLKEDTENPFSYIMEWYYPECSEVDQKMQPIPLSLIECVDKFKLEHSDPSKCAFVMMRFDGSRPNNAVFKAIETCCTDYGIKALRADGKEFSDDLFPNVRTYMHCCAFGIAVFDRMNSDDINPNVSLEVGYMYGLQKSICLLKDKTKDALQTDLVGKLYRSFDTFDPSPTIRKQLITWMVDKGFVTKVLPTDEILFSIS